jgi:signal transduction histidine kinase/CheY-like chemotaxis protein/HPt (histidine-containing phosphotransfer) domain-containing protein
MELFFTRYLVVMLITIIYGIDVQICRYIYSYFNFLELRGYKFIMNYMEQLNKLKETTLPHLPTEDAKTIFLDLLKQLDKNFRSSEFKLKRTIQDKQITTNVLENAITELKIQTENLKHQKILTEEQAAFKERLFANVSHELRTPLHGIIGMSHLLENTALTPVQQNYIEIIQSSADNLFVIINDLLNLSQINAGKTLLVKKPFAFEKFLHDLKGVLEFKAKGKGLNLIFNYPPNLPEFLLGDRTRLYQILLNLLNNAIKYTRQGYVALNIFVLKHSEKEVQLVFEIKDTGIGIKKDKLGAIFDSFTQLEVEKVGIDGGVGLGLNIVKKLLNMMDGKIKVTSLPDKGTTFTVHLDFDIPSKDLLDSTQYSNSAIGIPSQWQEKNILMIEDNVANLVYAQNLFAYGNVTLDIAENLEVAQQKVSKQVYDCILSDVKLPDGNGMDFIAKLRSDDSGLNQRVPIIVLTASANEKEKNYARKLDVQSYIGKPFPPELLISEMKHIFEDSDDKRSTQFYPEKKQTSPLITSLYFAPLEKNFKGKPLLQIEMFDIFLDQLPKAIEQMEKGLAENNYDLFHYEAHRIKSTINIIGLPQLQPIITTLDKYCYEKINLEQIPQLYQQFKKQALEDVQLVENKKQLLMAGVDV